MNRRDVMLGAFAAVAAATRSEAQAIQGGPAADRVAAAERSFAATMAKRDLDGFTALVAADAVFIGGGTTPRISRGRTAVVEWWRQFFTAPVAPFSWEPDLVEVLDNGTLGLTSGPVRDPAGKIVNRFSSIWRLDADGRWRIVFDKGEPVCG